MLGLFGFLGPLAPSSSAEDAFNQRRKEHLEKRLANALPWDPSAPWTKYQTIQSKSFEGWVPDIFPELKPTKNVFPHEIVKQGPDHALLSSDERWLICKRLFPRGESLWTARDNSGNVSGHAMFDADTSMLVLHYKREGEDYFQHKPLMSFTPMEARTLMLGARFAKGHVVMAGLGLGFQLLEVAKRKQVKKITMIERSASLVELMMPRLRPLIANGHEVDIIIDDAFKVLPQMTADVALVDTFPSFGGNTWERDKLFKSCPNINTIWCWGGGAAKSRS